MPDEPPHRAMPDETAQRALPDRPLRAADVQRRPDGDLLTRQELSAGYERPYRRWIPVAWEYDRVPRVVGAASLLTTAALVAHFVGGPDDELLAFALAGLFFVLCWAAWLTGHAASVIRNRIEDWKEDPADDLAAVRRRRQHAAEADPQLAHDEFAVAVDDAGDLVTWQFRPLAAGEEGSPDARLVAGRPRYEAREIARCAYDAVDAARAAEQLADAQEAAAALERDAAASAVHHAESARELEEEARTTAAALRSITGQDR